jgi:hypothetical protein
VPATIRITGVTIRVHVALILVGSVALEKTRGFATLGRHLVRPRAFSI